MLNKIRTCLFLCLLFVCIDSVVIYSLNQNNRQIVIEQNSNSYSDELQYFPIPKSLSHSDLTVSFVDTWNSSRNYGGDRLHEGCDIITSIDEPGIFPVVSMSDGVVEKIGWLELGGYRVGIRNESGLYLYYAHLESYAPGLSEGDPVSAGDCIGFVGNSGYGTEGTTGKFVTHLHLGLYVPEQDGDKAINPYPYLIELENKQLKYDYGEP